MKSLDAELELPTEEDENVGDGVPGKKKKRKKTKEERAASRKVVFWTLLIIIGITLLFWMWPKVKEMSFSLPTFKASSPSDEKPKDGWKNYVEYKL